MNYERTDQAGALRVLRGGHDVGREQLGADRGVAGLVDHLMALAIGDEDRGTQVRVEVGQLGAGADGDPHGHVGRVGGDRCGVGVGEIDDVGREEMPRVGDRQRERRVVDGVQPAERAAGTGFDDRELGAAEADQAVRELDDVLGRDLERAEAR